MSEQKILLVDDEPDIIEFLSYNLKKEGFVVFSANNGKQALELAKAETPDLVLLDVMMPDLDGIEVCSEIRTIPALKDVIIALLTARGEDYSQIAGFDAGADDYITKPIKPRLLISRINALLRRKGNTADQSDETSRIIKIGNISIDKERYLIVKDDSEMVLPKKEFELLTLLASKPGKVFTRDTILNTIWGGDVVVGDRTIDVHVRKLREKLGDKYIRTVKGVGYTFEV